MRQRRVVASALSAAYVLTIPAALLAAIGEKPATLAAPVLVALTLRPVQRALRRMTGADRTPQDALIELAAALAESHDPDTALDHLRTRILAATGARRVEICLGGIDDIEPGVTAIPVPVRGEDAKASLLVERGERPLPPQEVLEALAAQVAPAVANLRARQELVTRVRRLEELAAELRESRRRVIEIGDAERRILERDLHDGAQQCLMALVLRLGLRRNAGDDEVIDDLLARARSTLIEASGGWAAAGLEREGLVEALRRHTHALGDGSPEVTVESAGLPPLPAAVARAAFFACVEGVQNAVKHASAERVTVSLEASDDELTFTVTDDGIGFDASVRGLGGGLAGLRERVDALGGALALDSAPGGGTSLVGVVPLESEVAA